MAVLTVALLCVGLALLVAEAHVPSFGLLGAGGIAAVVGGIVLAVVGAGGSIALALGLALPLAAGAVVVGGLAITKTRAAARRRARCGAEGLVGQLGVVRQPLDPQGQVLVDGALWRARRSWAEEDEPPPAEGEAVVVDQVHGLTLSVRRAEVWEVEP
jgi:membrane-bound ClpP family serine protease